MKEQQEPVKTEEKDKDWIISDLIEVKNDWKKCAMEAQQEIERLKALIKKAYYAGVADEQSDEGTFNDFERQNNL